MKKTTERQDHLEQRYMKEQREKEHQLVQQSSWLLNNIIFNNDRESTSKNDNEKKTLPHTA